MAAQEALLSGFLHKQGEKGLVKGWKKRWVIVTPDSPHLIRYQRKVMDPEELGQINLTQVQSVQAGDRNDRGNEWLFYIDTPGRRYNLLAPDEDTMKYWMEGVEKVTGCSLILSLLSLRTHCGREYVMLIPGSLFGWLVGV